MGVLLVGHIQEAIKVSGRIMNTIPDGQTIGWIYSYGRIRAGITGSGGNFAAV